MFALAAPSITFAADDNACLPRIELLESVDTLIGYSGDRTMATLLGEVRTPECQKRFRQFTKVNGTNVFIFQLGSTLHVSFLGMPLPNGQVEGETTGKSWRRRARPRKIGQELPLEGGINRERDGRH